MPFAPLGKDRVRPHIRNPWVMLAASAFVLAAAAPCAARGTGGFLRDWAACGPLEGTQLDEPKLAADFAAYPGLFSLGHVWLPVQAAAEGRLDIRELYPKTTSGTALLHTFFEVPADGTYYLRVGSDDAVRIEVDGRTVHRNDTRRAFQADQDMVKMQLAKGWHRILVRVVDYGGAWAASVRVADQKDQPIEVRHQPAVPRPLERLCRLDEPLSDAEREATAAFITAQVAQLEGELTGAGQRLEETPEGYVTFAEYEGARAQGLLFLQAMAAFWEEAAQDVWDAEAARAAQHAVTEAARGFSEVLAEEAAHLGEALARGHKVWESLGDEGLSRRRAAADVLQIGQLLAQTRQLAARVETERILAARFENDIRNFRQRDMTVRVVDADGGPVAGADVEIVQTGHDFLFGCNLFAFRRWDSDKQNSLYERRFRDLFNLAVVPLYWSALEKHRGQNEFETADAAIRWCRQQHIEVRGHPLLWSDTVPRWMDELGPVEARTAIQARVRQVIQRYGDAIDVWDVLQRPRSPMRIGPASLDPIDALRWASDARPRGLLLAGGADAEPLLAIARDARTSGVRLDAVSIAAHQHEGVWPLEVVRKTIDAAAAAGLPVHVSEVAILGGREDEAEQAEAVRHFYTAAFAHPKVAGITWWDLSDRFAWRSAPVGLLRADLALKPAYRVLDRLLNHVWLTDAAGRSSDNGKVAVRGFFGQYRITAHAGRRKASVDVYLRRDGPAEFEIVLPPGK